MHMYYRQVKRKHRAKRKWKWDLPFALFKYVNFIERKSDEPNFSDRGPFRGNYKHIELHLFELSYHNCIAVWTIFQQLLRWATVWSQKT